MEKNEMPVGLGMALAMNTAFIGAEFLLFMVRDMLQSCTTVQAHI